jgi:flavin reductase (DIM6/NTAB) family NADH-FMN oxidoreductase RutF
MAVDEALKKQVLRKITYGLYVVTAHGGTEWSAATVNWLSQCAFVPPLVMMGIQRDSGLHALARETGRAAVHVLAAGQKNLAADFFRPTREENGRLNGHPYRLDTAGLPILTEIPWFFTVEAREWVDRGDHSVLVAEVVGVGKNAEAESPLIMADTGWSYGG